MPLTVPLMVRLLSKGGALNITGRLLDDVQYGNAAPGGYSTASCQLSRPLAIPAPELAAYTVMEIVDAASGQQLWYGRLEDPGRSSSGNVWQLGAVGFGSHTRDLSMPVIYLDDRVGSFQQYQARLACGGQWSAVTDDNNVDDAMLSLQWPKGANINPTSRVQVQNGLSLGTGQHIAYIRAQLTAGKVSGSYFVDYVGRGGPDADAVLRSWSFTTTQTFFQARLAVEYTTLHGAGEIRIRPTAGTIVVADDDTWAQATDVNVTFTRLTRYGVEDVAATNYSVLGALSWQIIEDLLGRFMPELDPTGSEVDQSSSIRITHMAYEDGTDAASILDDLMLLQPTHWWAVWGGDANAAFQLPGYNVSAGARFRWQPWPTTVSLEGLDTTRDVFESSGSAAELYNEVSVRYKDSAGRTMSVLRTATSPALAKAGLRRRALLDLGSQIGTKVQAQALGDNFLAGHIYPSNGGTIKVSRPLRDATTGRLLKPRELRAGVLARVANLAPQVDQLNTAATNGSTVFRVSDVRYSAKDDEATLTLDSYSRSVSRQLALLRKRTSSQRRL